jgi:hypothetical protein
MSRFLEKLRLQIQSEAEIKRHQLEVDEARREANRAREEQEAQMSIDALNNSIVPQYARELEEIITGKKDEYPIINTSHISITVRQISTFDSLKILIDGQPDGSVMIGSRRLNQQDKYNPKKVDSALEYAYNHPEMVNSDYGISY